MKKPAPHSFEATYPAITRWVKDFGQAREFGGIDPFPDP
jgi:hypothetical protein